MAVTGAQLVDYARQQIGKPYVWGAEGPNSFDCSGLMQYTYSHYGLKIPRVTHDQVQAGVSVPVGQQKPGDLVFSSWDGKPHSHVGMYTGSGTLIQAPRPGTKVQETKLSSSYLAHVDAIRRMPGVEGGPASAVGGGALGAIGLPGGLPLPAPTTIVDALANIGRPLQDIAGAAAESAQVARLITHAFLPTSLMRGALLLTGGVFVLVGVFFIGREVKSS